MPTLCDMWLSHSALLQTYMVSCYFIVFSFGVCVVLNEYMDCETFGYILMSATKQLYHIWLLSTKRIEEKIIFLPLEKLCRYLKALLNMISGILDIATVQRHKNSYNKRLKKAKIRQI